MRKAAVIVIALTFTGSCVGLWFLSWVGSEALKIHRSGYAVPELTWFVLSNRNGLFLIPLPFLAWCIATFRGLGPTSDHVTLFAAVTAFVFLGLFFVVVIGLFLPLIAIVDFLDPK